MSRRDVELPADGWIVRAGDNMFEISFGSMPPEAAAAELLLLADGFISALSLRHPKEKVKVRLLVSNTPVRATALVSRSGLELAVSRTELLAWVAFFLRYYRDGVAEVDHFDLEADREGSKDAVVDVCIRVADSR